LTFWGVETTLKIKEENQDKEEGSSSSRHSITEEVIEICHLFLRHGGTTDQHEPA
jgi:hypothetical protein